MKTDKDIREFMHENRPAASDSGAFMAAFVKRMELLPVPASLDNTDSWQERKVEAGAIAEIFEAAKAKNRKMAVLSSVSTVALSSAVAVLFSFFPDSWFSFSDLLSESYISQLPAKYLLMGFLVMAIVAIPISRTVSGIFRRSDL